MPKILVVEDCEESRDSLAGQLEHRGFDVVVAGDGKTGVALAQTEKPDLILMDMNMPEMDGWEATRQIKSATGGASLPVIALIENAIPGDCDQAVEVGCVDCHSKPIEVLNLLGQIEAILLTVPTPEVPALATGGCLPKSP